MSSKSRKKTVPTQIRNSHVPVSSEQGVTDYKNQNVLFRIHSPTKDENYLGKTFPAKFSINISQQTNQLGPSREGIQNSSVQEPQAIFAHEDEEYIKELQGLLHQNQQNNNALEDRLRMLEQQNLDIKQFLYQNKREDSEYNERAKGLQYQIDRLRQKIAELQQSEKEKDDMIEQLLNILKQKQQLILQISKANDEGYIRKLHDQQNQVALQVRRMDKWLKGLSRIIKSGPSISKQNNNKMQQFLHKFELLMKQNADLQANNQQAYQTLAERDQQIRELSQSLRQAGSQCQYCAKTPQYPKPGYGMQPIHIQERDGIVKIKMDLLLIEKDKRISALQQEIEIMKSAILDYKNQIHRLSYHNGRMERQMRNEPYQLRRPYLNDYDVFNCQAMGEYHRQPLYCASRADYHSYQQKMERTKSIDFDRFNSADRQGRKSSRMGPNEARSGTRSYEHRHLVSPHHGCCGKQIEKFQAYKQVIQRIPQ